MIKYQAKLEKEEDGYSVSFPDLEGCFTQGDTYEEALEMAKDALSLYLEELRDPDWIVPKPTKKKLGKSYEWITPNTEVAIPLMIRQIRQKHNLSQKQMAKVLNITFQQLQKLETPYKSNPTVKTLNKISNALNSKLEISF